MKSSQTLITILLLSGLTLALPRTTNKRIIGGTESPISNHPYQVSLFISNSFAGSGSIIAPNKILTAAHCIDGVAARKVSVRAGSSTHADGGTLLNVSAIAMHPQYSSPVVLENDIAVLTLVDDLPFGVGEEVGLVPVTLPALELSPGVEFNAAASSFPAAGRQVVISGWGGTAESGPVSKTLRTVTVDVIANSECAEMYGTYTIPITDGMFCAGVPGGGKGSCKGDSGGPVMADGVLAGIVSWGLGCARATKPGVNTRVAFYRDWIAEVAGV
ncbi:trypsin-like cysteine/serine peptidase domain-containing protein [Aspergillus californicus]